MECFEGKKKESREVFIRECLLSDGEIGKTQLFSSCTRVKHSGEERAESTRNRDFHARSGSATTYWKICRFKGTRASFINEGEGEYSLPFHLGFYYMGLSIFSVSIWRLSSQPSSLLRRRRSPRPTRDLPSRENIGWVVVQVPRWAIILVTDAQTKPWYLDPYYSFLRLHTVAWPFRSPQSFYEFYSLLAFQKHLGRVWTNEHGSFTWCMISVSLMEGKTLDVFQIGWIFSLDLWVFWTDHDPHYHPFLISPNVSALACDCLKILPALGVLVWLPIPLLPSLEKYGSLYCLDLNE